MDYEIVSANHKIYLKLDGNGTPVTCSYVERSRFDQAKAKNILKSLPKTLRKFNFRVNAIPDIPPKVIQNPNYVPSDNVIQWIEKFGQCGDILQSARERNEVLIEELSRLDKEIVDILHTIELERPKDLYHAWMIYIDIRTNRKKRRDVKDELKIINNVIKGTDLSVLQRDRIQKAVDGLLSRKYTYRIIETDDQEENKEIGGD